jgi:hypothetical protein
MYSLVKRIKNIDCLIKKIRMNNHIKNKGENHLQEKL